ncbi:MAG: RNA methyltransferase [Ignavibacteriae bacterium]|nr:RNA methyltransferase [Ignavibacteriota bacterium]
MNKLNILSTGSIKLVSSLKNKKKRDEYRLYIVEGEKLCEELFNSTYNTKFIILKTEHSANSHEIAKRFERKKIPVYFISELIFNKITDTVTPQDIIAIVNFKDEVPLIDESFIALDQISDPGNIGTIIRTAEWFGFKQVILSVNCADKYNPKLVRSTMGSLFRIKIITGIKLENDLKKIFPDHKIFGASLDSKTKLESIKVAAEFGLVFGSESHGITKNVQKILDDKFKITGSGIESLNVSVAAGISMYHFSLKKT